MAGKVKVAIGAILLIPSAVLFALDFISLTSLLLELLAILAFVTSILTGRKIAAYLHDLHLASERNYKMGPAMFIYAWLVMFVLFILIYTIAKMALGYFIKLALLPLGGSYMGLIYNLLSLFASYLLFAGIYAKKDSFLTLWGKAAEKSEKAGNKMHDIAGKPASVAEKTAGKMGEEMRKFMP